MDNRIPKFRILEDRVGDFYAEIWDNNNWLYLGGSLHRNLEDVRAFLSLIRVDDRVVEVIYE